MIDLIQTNAKDAELGPVLETTENALRADQAKMIEAEKSRPLEVRWNQRPLPTACRPGGELAADLFQQRISPEGVFERVVEACIAAG